MKTYLLIIVIILSALTLRAQTTCTDILKQAQRNFDEGKLDEIPQMIEPCMKDGFTNEEKMNAYKLLIQTYLFNEKPEQADQVMIRFLKEFPSYEIAVNDPTEFINLHKTYRTEPIFRIDINAGLNYSMPSVTEVFGPGNINLSSISYKSMLGFNLGLNYTDRIYKDFDIVVGVNFSIYNIDYNDFQYDYTTVTGSFKSMFVGFPLAANYNLNLGNIRIISRLGVETTYLLSSKMDFTKSFRSGENPIKSNEDIKSCFKQLDFKPTISLGFPFKISKYEILPTIGFKFSTISPLKDRLKYPIESGVYYKYNFAPANMLMNQFFFTVSFMKPIYNPQKIK